MTTPIVNAARRYLGVRYLHQGRIDINAAPQHQACDCIGLVIAAAQHMNARTPLTNADIASIDEQNYPMLPDEQRLIYMMQKHLRPRDISDIQEGDIALFRMGKRAQHLGIITDYAAPQHKGVIHCYRNSGKVVEHHLDEKWRSRITALFSL